MKKTLFLSLLLFTGFFAVAQALYTGVYGYTQQAPAGAPASEASRGPHGKLVLIKMEGNQYRFWLDAGLGWPDYQVGETDGTLTFVHDTASFDNTFEDATAPCILFFRVNGKSIEVSSQSASFNCGFGSGVKADGVYTWLENQEKMDNSFLKKQYPQSPVLKIKADKAQLYRDQDGFQSFPEKRYMSKGESLLNIAETGKTVYTEFITAGGELHYGWLRKTDLDITD